MAISSVKVLINGVETVLTYNSTSGKYEATITAPSQTSGMNNSGSGPGVGSNASGLGYYPITVTATDDANNSTSVDSTDTTYGNILRLKVLETAKPTAAISYPSAGATITNSKPTITFTITDAGSGVNPAACYIKVDGGTAVAVTPSISGSVATCSYTPSSNLADGNHTIAVYGSDYDGNTSDEASASFKIDTTPPTLNISAPVNNLLTNNASCTVSGTTNDANSTPVTVVITVGSTTYTPTIGNDGSFSQVVTLSEGSNTITIKATDSAGLESTVTRTVVLDTAAPQFVSITITPNPVNTGASYKIEVEVTDS